MAHSPVLRSPVTSSSGENDPDRQTEASHHGVPAAGKPRGSGTRGLRAGHGVDSGQRHLAVIATPEGKVDALASSRPT